MAETCLQTDSPRKEERREMKAENGDLGSDASKASTGNQMEAVSQPDVAPAAERSQRLAARLTEEANLRQQITLEFKSHQSKMCQEKKRKKTVISCTFSGKFI